MGNLSVKIAERLGSMLKMCFFLFCFFKHWPNNSEVLVFEDVCAWRHPDVCTSNPISTRFPKCVHLDHDILLIEDNLLTTWDIQNPWKYCPNWLAGFLPSTVLNMVIRWFSEQWSKSLALILCKELYYVCIMEAFKDTLKTMSCHTLLTLGTCFFSWHVVTCVFLFAIDLFTHRIHWTGIFTYVCHILKITM